MIKLCWWRYRHKFWRYNHYLKQKFILRKPGVAIFADIIKIVPFLLKQSLNTQEELKESETLFRNAIYTCISWYSKICWFGLKIADVSGIQGVCPVIHIFFGSF